MFDSRLTTYANLARLEKMGITFITLRRRSPALLKEIALLPRSAWRTVELDVSARKFRTPRVFEQTIPLAGESFRQLFIQDLGHDEPTLLLTNDRRTSAAKLITRYAQRMLVARVWRKHALRPHRFEGYMASNDPDFETKAAEIIGLYLHPPQHAAVFCVDEKTAIQALDRKGPVLPLSPGRAERHGFEYYRHGTLSLYAAFNTKTGDVLGKTAARHTSAELVAFLTDIVANQPRGKEIHVIADNLSAHKSQPVKDFLETHTKVHLHFTPTYSSWLNQVELWFSKIERDVIARGVFTSVPDLKRKLMRYIRQYNKAPKTVKWKYFDPSRRMTTQSAVTGH